MTDSGQFLYLTAADLNYDRSDIRFLSRLDQFCVESVGNAAFAFVIRPLFRLDHFFVIFCYRLEMLLLPLSFRVLLGSRICVLFLPKSFTHLRLRFIALGAARQLH